MRAPRVKSFRMSPIPHEAIADSSGISTDSRKEFSMARYSKGAQDSVQKAMHKRKKGTLKSGSGKKVKSKKQAIAIGLSEARKKGKKVPAKKSV